MCMFSKEVLKYKNRNAENKSSAGRNHFASYWNLVLENIVVREKNIDRSTSRAKNQDLKKPASRNYFASNWNLVLVI